MKVLLLVPIALVLTACSSVNIPLSPYRIDVQQGNALEQESVEKLKTGLTRSQVRFLLGTPLLVDPFHGNRWDYVYNFRKAGKLTEERRLVLFFEGDVLVRIEAEGLTLNTDKPEAKPAEPQNPIEKAAEPQKSSAVETAPVAAPEPVESAKPISVEQPSPAVQAPAEAANPKAADTAKTGQPASADAAVAPAENAKSSVQAVTPTAMAAAAKTAETATADPATKKKAPSQAGGSEETSIVRPLRAEPEQATQPSQPKQGQALASPSANEPVVLQTEANVDAIKPDAMPEFPDAAAPVSPEGQIRAAVSAWAEAWRSRNEEAYLGAYADSFRPAGGQTREQWEKRRRLLLGISRNIDLQIEDVAVESVAADSAQVTFRQYYRSDTYRDAVIKQLKFVRVDGRWLIEEENVQSPIRGGR